MTEDEAFRELATRWLNIPVENRARGFSWRPEHHPALRQGLKPKADRPPRGRRDGRPAR